MKYDFLRRDIKYYYIFQYVDLAVLVIFWILNFKIAFFVWLALTTFSMLSQSARIVKLEKELGIID